MNRYTAQFLLLSFFISGCGATKWVNDPFHYAPKHPNIIWTPPKNDRVALTLPPLDSQTPLGLSSLIDIGLIHSPETHLSWAKARGAAALYTQSMATDFPQINANVSTVRERYTVFQSSFNPILLQPGLQPLFQSTPQTTLYETLTSGDLTLAYTLLDFGERDAVTRSFLEALYNADWTHNDTIRKVAQTISNSYYDYLYAMELVKANEADLKDAQSVYDASMQKLQSGVVDLSDSLEAYSQLLESKITLVDQMQTTENAFIDLADAMGVSPDQKFNIVSFPETINPPAIEDLKALIEIASSHRPDLMASLSNVRSKEASVRAAVLNLYPNVATNLDIGRTYFDFKQNDDYHFTVGFTLSYPVFVGFQLRNAVRIARANLEAAEASLQNVKLTVLSDLTRYRSDLLFALDNLTNAANYLKAAEQEFRVVFKQYTMGTKTIIDLISSQTTLANARAKNALAYQNWFNSLANLTFSTGILYAP